MLTICRHRPISTMKPGQGFTGLRRGDARYGPDCALRPGRQEGSCVASADTRSGDNPTDNDSLGLHRDSSPRQRRLVQVLTVVLLVAPVVGYFWLIHHYARNVVFYDQWSDVRLVAHPSFSALWVQHNENRILFPNLVVLLLAHTTHLNIVVEEFLSATLLVGATVLIALVHHRRSPSTPWFAYIPLVLLLFSFVQDGDTLWGFQLAWYMVLLALAGCIYLLDRPNLIGPVFAAAVIVAVVGSFSSLQGLLIWPVGMVLNYQRRRGRAWQLGWILSGVITTVVYFYDLNSSTANPGGSFALTHLNRSLMFFLTAIGNIFGGQVYDVYGAHVPGAPDLGSDGTLALGVVVFVFALLTLAIFGRRDQRSAGPIASLSRSFRSALCGVYDHRTVLGRLRGRWVLPLHDVRHPHSRRVLLGAARQATYRSSSNVAASRAVDHRGACGAPGGAGDA